MYREPSTGTPSNVTLVVPASTVALTENGCSAYRRLPRSVASVTVVSPAEAGAVQDTVAVPSASVCTVTPVAAFDWSSGASAAREREPSLPTAYSLSVPEVAGRCLT